jgi:FlaA1/EpsC-like NDP-sugar epimerase
LAAWIRYGSIMSNWFSMNMYGIAVVIVLLLYMVIYYLFDTYSRLSKRGFLEEMLVIVKINCILAVTIMAVLYLFQEGTYFSRLFFLCFFFLNILITYIFRLYFKLLLFGLYKRSSSSYKVMVITTSDQVHNLLERIHNENEWDYQITYLTIIDKNMMGQKID